MQRKLVLATIGSLGDLHPFLALARSLQSRGFEPVIASYAEYQSKVETAGVAFVPIRPSIADLQNDLGMARAEMTRRAIDNPHFMFRRLIVPYLQDSYDDMLAALDGAHLLLTSSLAFSARFAAEKRAIPCIGIVLQPMMFLSAYDPPLLIGGAWFSTFLRRVGPRVATPILKLFRLAVRGLLKPIDDFRTTIGLPRSPVDPLFDGQFSKGGAIALYSSTLAMQQPDYPTPTSVSGFTWFDSFDGAPPELDRELEKFLAAGARPLVLTFGSLVAESSESIFPEAIKAARELQLRIVVLVGETAFERLSKESSDDVCIVRYAAHSLLFARAAAVIHHGGIGTMAQAMRAGQPQLIVPFLADQADNAARAAALGMARVLPNRKFKSARVINEIQALLNDHRYRSSAENLRRILSQEDGAENAARIIERVCS